MTDPSHAQYRFLREPLDLQDFVLSVERFAPGFRPAAVGTEEATIVVIAAPQTGLEDVGFLADFWAR